MGEKIPLLGLFPPACYLWFITEKGLGQLVKAAHCYTAPWEKENYPPHQAQQDEAAAANSLPTILFILSIEMSIRRHLNTVLSQSTKLVGCTMYNLCTVWKKENWEFIHSEGALKNKHVALLLRSVAWSALTTQATALSVMWNSVFKDLMNQERQSFHWAKVVLQNLAIKSFQMFQSSSHSLTKDMTPATQPKCAKHMKKKNPKPPQHIYRKDTLKNGWKIYLQNLKMHHLLKYCDWINYTNIMLIFFA